MQMYKREEYQRQQNKAENRAAAAERCELEHRERKYNKIKTGVKVGSWIGKACVDVLLSGPRLAETGCWAVFFTGLAGCQPWHNSPAARLMGEGMRPGVISDIDWRARGRGCNRP